MKKILLIASVIIIGILTIFGLILSSKSSSKEQYADRNVFHETNIQMTAKNTVEAPHPDANTNEPSGQVIATNSAPCLFKVITDPSVGQYAAVDSNREAVTLKDKDDHIIWSTNIIKAAERLPIFGERKIGFMKLHEGMLLVYIDRNVFSVDKQTGAVTYCGAN